MATLEQSTTLHNSNFDPIESPLTSNGHPLPTARATLTNLLNAIASIPLLPAPDSKPDSDRLSNPKDAATRSIINNKVHDRNDNPLRRVPPTHRHLLITLHVLFPGLVLPALDLLERGLVARLALATTEGHRRGKESGGTGDGGSKVEVRKGHLNGAGGDGDGDEDEDVELAAECEVQGERGGTTPASAPATSQTSQRWFYLVQSSAAAEASASRDRMRRRRKHSDGYGEEGDGGAGTGTAAPRGYIVRLGAWHCSCAAFAFSSVQGGSGSVDWGDEAGNAQEQGGLRGGTGDMDTMEWSFGGMSLDGLAPGTGEGVPLCKHLLACLLAERWSAALGRYVVERRVGREEMAGIVADV